MFNRTVKLRLSALTVLLLVIAGCSGQGGNPTEPTDVAVLSGADRDGSESGRYLWGIWDISFDLDMMKVNIEPGRNLQAHFDITEMIVPPACDDCLEIAVNSFDPVTRIIDVDVTLRNPYNISGRDVRGILYTNAFGHELQNDDGWTELYDIPVGNIFNPFKAFAKTETNRVFAAMAEHTENYQVYIPKPPHYIDITFAVDANWPGNCKEPYAVENFLQIGEMYDFTNASVEFKVDVLDWQDDVSGVTLIAPELIGFNFASFSHEVSNTWSVELENNEAAPAGDYDILLMTTSENSDNPLYNYFPLTIHEAVIPIVTGIDPDSALAGEDLIGVTVTGSDFEGPGVEVRLRMSGEPDIDAANVDLVDANTITCDISIPSGAESGIYDVAVINGPGAPGVGAELFEVFQPVPDSPVDVTPPWLNFSPMGVCYSGDYAYVAGGVNGLHIFDVSDPANPIWVNWVETDDKAFDVVVSGGYAYVAIASTQSGLQIIDIEPPGSANIVKTVDTTDARAVVIDGGYAYIADFSAGLRIIDIDPIDEAYVVNTVDTPGSAVDVAVEAGYAYVADWTEGLQIIDVDPPESATIVIAVDTDDNAKGVDVDGDYAYVAIKFGGLQIIDINPPESASSVNTVNTPGSAEKVVVSNGFAYVADRTEGLQIIDVDPPETAIILNSVDTPARVEHVALGTGFVLIGDRDAGIGIIDVDPIELAFVTGVAPTPGHAYDVVLSGSNAFIANDYAGLNITSIDPVNLAHYVNDVDIEGQLHGVDYTWGSIFGADPWLGGLRVFDVSPLDEAYLTKTVELYAPEDVLAGWGVVYLADASDGLKIVDTYPLDEAYVVQTVGTTDAQAVALADGYAYVADGTDGLRIIDVDPIDEAYIVNTIATDDEARGVAVYDGYAYVADDSAGLQIIDVDPPESAAIVNTVDTPGLATDVIISSGYAYVADGYNSGLQIIDIDPIETAYIVTGLQVKGEPSALVKEGNYIFIAARTGGLRIIQLW